MKLYHILSLLLLLSSLLIVSIKADDNTLEYNVDATDGSDAEGDGSSGSPFASLNGALTAFTAATSTATEPLYNLIINVKKGTYTGNDNLGLPFFVNTTVQNMDDEDNTVIFDCEFGTVPYAFDPLYGSFELVYVTIQNCVRGVNVEYTATLPYQDVYLDHIIFQNISQNAIWVEHPSSMAVKNSLFSSPSGDSYNAFINIIGDFSAGVDILNNGFQDGSDILISYMNGGNINENTFQNMFGDGADSPPALYISGGVWDIYQNTFTNISSNQYSTATFHSSSLTDDDPVGNYSLTSNTFTDCNTTTLYGGAVSFVGVLGEVTDCEFVNNYARLGGAVFLSSSNVTIQKSTFTDNYAVLNGGAIDIELSSVLFLYDNDFESNTAGTSLTPNSLSCCVAGGATTNCTSTLYINDGAQGDFADQEACENIQYVSTKEYFQTLQSYAYQPFTTSGGSSLWWLWTLISFALIAMIIVVGVAIGAFIYTKKKRSYEAYA